MCLGGDTGPNFGTTINKIACAINGWKLKSVSHKLFNLLMHLFSGLVVYPDTFINLERNHKIGGKSAKQHYIDVIKGFQTRYTDVTRSAKNLVECHFGYQLQDGNECRYDFMWLERQCAELSGFGYIDNNPCIFLVYNETNKGGGGRRYLSKR
ncbi:hypothetical protein E2C01_031128 [Portunus trituberculatus]|uniref:Uncharacterized protein n=1 Tax=Portunus trituberculatus TaxID=210409 RepID=A0A5B7ETP4_PORTR|nr:hypothetical protein [Portunus trituberculatus]